MILSTVTRSTYHRWTVRRHIGRQSAKTRSLYRSILGGYDEGADMAHEVDGRPLSADAPPTYRASSDRCIDQESTNNAAYCQPRWRRTMLRDSNGKHCPKWESWPGLLKVNDHLIESSSTWSHETLPVINPTAHTAIFKISGTAGIELIFY